MVTLVGCGDDKDPASSAEQTTPRAQVGQFSSPNPGSVNTFWLRAPDGLIVFDGGRNTTGGRAAVAEIKKTGEPVAAILITHPHPDHIGGLGALHAAFPAAPIYASRATTEFMRDDPTGFYPLARKDDPDFPGKLTYPDRVVAQNATLQIGGLSIETKEYGVGESATATSYYVPRDRLLFPGDLVSNEMTPALIEGQTCGWLQNLDRLKESYPNAGTVYPGHGEPAPTGRLIAAQQTYLDRFRDLVRGAISRGSRGGRTVTRAETTAILSSMEKRYPKYPNVAALPTLQQVNVASVAKELTSERQNTSQSACER